TGTNLLAETPQGLREFSFRRGPIFANVVLADEINRATPRTQAAFLEALPEAQLDRFFFKLTVETPSTADLAEILARTTGTGAVRVSARHGAATVREM